MIREASAESLLSATNLKNVLKSMFEHTNILTTQVKVGSKSSANIYVPRKHVGKLVTVIIWDN